MDCVFIFFFVLLLIIGLIQWLKEQSRKHNFDQPYNLYGAKNGDFQSDPNIPGGQDYLNAMIVLDAAEHGIFFPDGERVFDRLDGSVPNSDYYDAGDGERDYNNGYYDHGLNSRMGLDPTNQDGSLPIIERLNDRPGIPNLRSTTPDSGITNTGSNKENTFGYGKWDNYDLRTGEIHSIISNPFGGTLSMALNEARKHGERLGLPIEIYIKQNDEWKWIDKVYPSALASIGYYKNGVNHSSNSNTINSYHRDQIEQPETLTGTAELINLPPGYCPVCGYELEHIIMDGAVILEPCPYCHNL